MLLEIKMPRFEELRQILGQILQESPNCYCLYDQILNQLNGITNAAFILANSSSRENGVFSCPLAVSYGLFILIGFLLLGGFRFIILPVVGMLYSLL
jgi:hypothetical protein